MKKIIYNGEVYGCYGKYETITPEPIDDSFENVSRSHIEKLNGIVFIHLYGRAKKNGRYERYCTPAS